MLRECDLDGVHYAFKSFLASIPYEANKDERAKDFETHFSYTFYLIFRLLSCYTTLIEKQNSKGRADVIIETDNDVFIFEFKLDGSAEEALAQIEEKQYAVPYLDDRRKVHKIGVNILSESRTKIFLCTAVNPFGTVSSDNLDFASFFISKLGTKFFEDFFTITLMNPDNFILVHIIYYCDVLMTFLVTCFINTYPYYIIMNTC